MSQWFRLPDTHEIYGTQQPNVSSFEECQKACVSDPRCDDVYFWENYDRTVRLCYTNTVQSDTPSLYYSTVVAHYGFFSRCNITSGECFMGIYNISVTIYDLFATLLNIPRGKQPHYLVPRRLSTDPKIPGGAKKRPEHSQVLCSSVI